MVKNTQLNIRRLDAAFQYMKTRSLVENLSLLPLGNNILICNRSDYYKVFIASNPEARIIRNNFAELPELDNGRWIEFLSLHENCAENGGDHPLARDKVISEFVTEKLNNLALRRFMWVS